VLAYPGAVPPPPRRDRHGRGLRGPLAPREVPVGRTRAERFDELVLDAFERVAERWGAELAGVEVLVEDVPPVAADPGGGPGSDPAPDATADPVRLGRTEPATRRRAARLIVYRRPIEARARESRDRGDLVHDVVVGLVADLLGLEPEQIDPDVDDG
jgi:predicted Zn-dependent protease with MMP-like domain